ncbi:MAG: hypothetical protein ACR2OU_00900 [Thermomicrobiales bacterium]
MVHLDASKSRLTSLVKEAVDQRLIDMTGPDMNVSEDTRERISGRLLQPTDAGNGWYLIGAILDDIQGISLAVTWNPETDTVRTMVPGEED